MVLFTDLNSLTHTDPVRFKIMTLMRWFMMLVMIVTTLSASDEDRGFTQKTEGPHKDISEQRLKKIDFQHYYIVNTLIN